MHVLILSDSQGIQVYHDVTDEEAAVDATNTPDFVELFAANIEPSIAAGSGMTRVFSLSGIFGIANTTLSFEVECLPGFVGESCVPVCSTDPCSNNGACLQSVSGFTCTCRGDFTGETCETRINDCQDVDCNNGTCVDGVLSFTCQCDQSFTGDFCEVIISSDPTIATEEGEFSTISSNPTTGSDEKKFGTISSNLTIGSVYTTPHGINIAGVVGGVLVGIILVLATLLTVTIIFTCVKKENPISSAIKGGSAICVAMVTSAT